MQYWGGGIAALFFMVKMSGVRMLLSYTDKLQERWSLIQEQRDQSDKKWKVRKQL
jgi:hypothetical protein